MMLVKESNCFITAKKKKKKKISLPLRVSSVNATKFAISRGFGNID